MYGIRNTVRSADLNLTWPLQADAAAAAAQAAAQAAATSAGAWAWLIEIKFLNWEISGTCKEKPDTEHRRAEDDLLLLLLLAVAASGSLGVVLGYVCRVL